MYDIYRQHSCCDDQAGLAQARSNYLYPQDVGLIVCVSPPPCILSAGEVLQQPSVNVTAKIHQFYQDVQQRRREEFGEDDITSDIRNIPGKIIGSS